MKCVSCGKEISDSDYNKKCYKCSVECYNCGLTIDGDLRSGCPSCGSYIQNEEYSSNGESVLHFQRNRTQ